MIGILKNANERANKNAIWEIGIIRGLPGKGSVSLVVKLMVMSNRTVILHLFRIASLEVKLRGCQIGQ